MCMGVYRGDTVLLLKWITTVKHEHKRVVRLMEKQSENNLIRERGRIKWRNADIFVGYRMEYYIVMD